MSFSFSGIKVGNITLGEITVDSEKLSLGGITVGKETLDAITIDSDRINIGGISFIESCNAGDIPLKVESRQITTYSCVPVLFITGFVFCGVYTRRPVLIMLGLGGIVLYLSLRS